MTKVALINPGLSRELAMQEPLNLGFLATYLKKNNIDVKIIDEPSQQNFYKEIEEFKPDFAGFTANTLVAKRAYELSSFCREKGIITIIGGRHPSIYPNEAAKYADYVVVGEGEKALLDIVQGKEKKGSIITREPIKDLDEIPMVDRQLLNMEFYTKTKDRFQDSYLTFVPLNTRTAGVITSRGCPYNCIFCFNSHKLYPFRFHSARRVVDEIKYLINNYKIHAIFFLDDNLFANRQRLREICDLIKKEKLDFIWGANARVDNITEEIIIAAKEAGCKQITFGFESGSQRILDLLNKGTTVEKAKEAIKIVKKHGLLATGTFMIGNPGETKEDIELTKKFIQENEIDSYGVCITTPYPGSKLFDICREQGLLPSEDSIDWNKFAHSEFPYYLSTKTLSKKEIKKAYYDLVALRQKNDALQLKTVFNFLIRNPKKFMEYVIYSPSIVKSSFKRLMRKNKQS